MENKDGRWGDKLEEVISLIEKYFANMLISTSQIKELIDKVMQTVNSRMSNEAQSGVDAPFTVKEVKNVVFSNRPTKSPSLDGFHNIIFQWMWHIVRD